VDCEFASVDKIDFVLAAALSSSLHSVPMSELNDVKVGDWLTIVSSIKGFQRHAATGDEHHKWFDTHVELHIPA
jgi:hypothetical protein